jgi:hypothetical protein
MKGRGRGEERSLTGGLTGEMRRPEHGWTAGEAEGTTKEPLGRFGSGEERFESVWPKG